MTQRPDDKRLRQLAADLASGKVVVQLGNGYPEYSLVGIEKPLAEYLTASLSATRAIVPVPNPPSTVEPCSPHNVVGCTNCAAAFWYASYQNACVEIERLAAPSATAAIKPPTQEEVAAYRDLFRAELDRNMHNTSASPSTDAHTVALNSFVARRNMARTDGRDTNG
jgi:hypothetical protein